MATLDSLRTSIIDLPDEEAHRLIRDIRHQRRTYVPPKKKTSSSPKVAKQKVNAIEQMGVSELETLIALLEGVIAK